MNPIYLDYNATTPLDPLVVREINSVLETTFGNPSSGHLYGWLDWARRRSWRVSGLAPKERDCAHCAITFGVCCRKGPAQ